MLRKVNQVWTALKHAHWAYSNYRLQLKIFAKQYEGCPRHEICIVIMWLQTAFNAVTTGAGIDGSCSRALHAIQAIRQRLGSSDVIAEQRANFAPYTKPSTSGKGQNWTVKMVCLSGHNATRVPCTVADRETLVQAGLGEKKINIPDISCSPQEFRNIVVAAFPKLDGCGGFDLLRCIPNTKDLEAISLAVSQSPKLLKSVVGGGKVFICPIQQDLDLGLDKKLIASVEVCTALRTSTHKKTSVI